MGIFLLELGLGWTTSKILPYLLAIVLGVIICVFVWRKVKRSWQKALSLVLIFIPFLLMFALSPIYEGDFANDVKQVGATNEFFEEKRLTVVAIPNCPFCLQSIERLLLYSERTAFPVEFYILSSDKSSMDIYKEASKGSRISVQLADTNQFEYLANLSEGRFPTFVFKKDKSLNVWHNDGFGTRALDWVEEQ